jgi:hypothetical protein
MKIAFVFNLMIELLWFSSINAQIEDQSVLLTDHKKNIEIPFEKIYLHLDRLYYSAGEDIWIKAYLVNARTNELSEASNNLNIELISYGSKIIKRLVLRIDNGIGAGDIHLEDSIPSGNYLIRAYTNWMRNFGDVFFFKKEIVIENQMDIKSLNQPDHEEINEKVDVQFFPEGGPLIENVYTLLGFKAVNSSGIGCEVKGQVISSLGDTVASFAGTHLGMGSFFFLPKKGLKYFATGYAGNGITFRAERTNASETGYSIKLSDINNDYFRVTIKTNQETLNKFPLNEIVIVGTSHNSLCITAKVKVRLIDNPVILPKREFPEGVALITLNDTIGKTYCERVYYIHQKKNYHISIIPDQEVYAPRQKVTLQIAIRDTSDNPVSANLSVSVVDGNQIEGFENKPDIISYLLLESEIRGYIEQPFYYFDTTIIGRYQALDNLLLTQGWRNFVWNNLPDKPIKFNYPAEEGITVSGRLRRVWADKPIAGANISLALLGNAKPSYKITQTDSMGKYYFDGLDFRGPQNLMVYATDKKDNGEGLILLDSLFRDPAPIKYDQANKTEAKNKSTFNNIYVTNLIQVSNYNEISNYKKTAEQKHDILKKYNITDTINLNEVEVKARRPEKENADIHLRPYGVPNFSLTVTDRMFSSPDVFQLLQGRVDGLVIFGDRYTGYQFIFRGQASGHNLTSGNGYLQEAGQPLFLIDGNEVEYATILAIPVTAVDKIEVIKDGGKLALYGFRGSFGVISVLTKRGSNGPLPPVLNFINQRVYGYYQARTFYKPRYDIKKPEYEKPDLRTTIHWEPNVVTDEEGNATISFFNTDSKTIIKVDVEGIAEPGIPLAGKMSFYVK